MVDLAPPVCMVGQAPPVGVVSESGPTVGVVNLAHQKVWWVYFQQFEVTPTGRCPQQDLRPPRYVPGSAPTHPRQPKFRLRLPGTTWA